MRGQAPIVIALVTLFDLFVDGGNARQQNWFAVGEFGNERKASAHGFDIPSQGGKHQVAAALESGDLILADAENFSYARLR